MQDHNSVTLSGCLAFNPAGHIPEGKNPDQEIITFTIATNAEWPDRSTGQTNQRTDFIGIACYGVLREKARLLRQGDRVLVTGQLRSEEGTGPRGGTSRKTKVRAHSIDTLHLIHPNNHNNTTRSHSPLPPSGTVF